MIIMFNEKVVLVTGGTRGIGYTTVEEFLKEGARVILFGSREESVTKAINSLKEENNEYKVEGYFTDLANLEEMEKVAMEDEKIKALVEGKTIVKVVAVPKKLVNIVVK